MGTVGNWNNGGGGGSMGSVAFLFFYRTSASLDEI
jgi:hypothetical protein